MQLFNITKDYKALQEMEDSEAVTETMKMIEGEFNDKAKGCLAVMANWDSDIEQIEAQIKRFQALKKTYTNRKEALKEYLRSNMEASGITKIESDFFSASLGKGSSIVTILNEENLPDEYVTVRTVVAPDKRAILAALKNGEEIQGAELSTGKSKLTIK